MKRINILDQKTAQLIAAGEITENPCCVVKELLENSIDAGATRITVEIKNGGSKFIKIIDNGHGIYREDVKDAFARHATSKIKNSEEINKISSLGFRGEALASISSVSKVELLTRSLEEDVGTRILISGGKFEKIEDTGCLKGTIIYIKDLFYNTPARMKFLKKDVVEGNKVASIVDKISLSHPEIFFKFIRDEKLSLCTPGDGKIASAIYSIYGKEFFEGMISINYKFGNIEVNGYVSKPEKCRPSKNMQIFFINGRLIKSKTNSIALEEAFKNSLMVNKNPYCVIYLKIPFDMVDINVHPAKAEVRYANEQEIFQAIYTAVKTALMNENKKILQNLKPKNHSNKCLNQKNENNQLTLKDSAFNGIIQLDALPENLKSSIKILSNPTFKETQTKNFNKQNINLKNFTEELFKPLPKKIMDSFKIIGEVFGCYLIMQCKNKLILIDKHAAHERIIFEKLKSQSRKYDSQLLISPITVTLEKQEYSAVIENLSLFSKSGYGIEDFGLGTVIIRSAPMYEDFNNLANSVIEIACYIMQNRKHTETKKLDWIYHNIACRNAIKAKSKTSNEELAKLVLDILNNPGLKYCPHGRPIYIEIEKNFIEKCFGRK